MADGPLFDSASDSRVVLWEKTVDASPAGAAYALRCLAEEIERANGDLVLIMLASTGFAEAWQWHFQATLDQGSDSKRDSRHD